MNTAQLDIKQNVYSEHIVQLLRTYNVIDNVYASLECKFI